MCLNVQWQLWQYNRWIVNSSMTFRQLPNGSPRIWRRRSGSTVTAVEPQDGHWCFVRFNWILTLFWAYFTFSCWNQRTFLCIVKIDRHCLPPAVWIDYLTIGAIPVFFNSVFLFFLFSAVFCWFLSQTVEEPFFGRLKTEMFFGETFTSAENFQQKLKKIHLLW